MTLTIILQYRFFLAGGSGGITGFPPAGHHLKKGRDGHSNIPSILPIYFDL